MTHVTLLNNETRLAASVHGRMDATPILLLHGITMSRDTWDEITPRLRDRYCVWTIDFRGHGHSARARITISQPMSLTPKPLSLYSRPAIVIGHSLGACLAGVLGQNNPNVRSVFLEDPPWFLGQPEDWQKSVFPNLFFHFVVATDEMARMSLHCLQPTCTFFQTGLTS